LNNILLARGLKVGKSKTEEEGKNYVDKAEALLSDEDVAARLRLPKDVVCTLADLTDPLEFPVSQIPDDRMVVDIVPDYFDDDMAVAQMALLVGPLGLYEKGYKRGTEHFVGRMPKNSLIFGADTAKSMKGVPYCGVISLGGGSGAELLSGKEWVAVDKLRENAKKFKFP